MRTRLMLAAATLPLAMLLPTTAHAIEIPLFASGGVTVYPDLTVCASVTFPAPTTFVGSFDAAGALYGPGTIVVPVAGANPIVGVNTRTWGPRCIPGAYAGASAGHVVITFHVSTSAGNDYLNVENCTVTFGTITCL